LDFLRSQAYLPDWATTHEAWIYLKPCTRKSFAEVVGPLLERKSGNRPGAQYHARSGGWLYARADLERVRAIMDALGVTASDAAKTFHRIKGLADKGAIEWILGRVLDHALQTNEKMYAANKQTTV
jgi:hypothetical protein